MNRKLILGAVAGVAAIGLAVGGTTYAAYSDFGDISNNTAGAGVLTLDLHGNQAKDVGFSHITMAPGGINAERQVYVASNSGASTPSALLSVSLTKLVGTEDGCDGNGEQADDPNCADTSAANQGQFITDATVQWYSYKPDSPGVCNESYATAKTVVTPQWGGSLQSLAQKTDVSLGGTPHALNGPALPYLAPGQGICFAMEVSLAYGVDNASQGDSASFDLHFDLEQAPAGTPTTAPGV